MIISKLRNIGVNVSTVMANIAEEFGAINLTHENSDFECADELLDLVMQYMKKGYNKYAPIEGVLELREVVSNLTEKNYSYKYDSETEVTITAGAAQALYSAISSFIKDGDEVIIFEPAYENYVPAIEANGGRPVFVALKQPDYRIEWDDLQKVINAKTRMIIINSPHNPSGSILSAFDMERLQKITNGTNIIILSDEVFNQIIFENYEHQSIARFPELVKRSIIISSFGKALNVSGWKIGYCLAPSQFTTEIRKTHQYQMSSVNTPIQYALAEYLKRGSVFKGLSKFYQNKRDYFNKLLAPSNFDIIPSKGSYFQLLSYKNISEEKDIDFAAFLAKEHKVATVPVSVFYHDSYDENLLRITFAKSDEILKKAAEQLLRL